MPAARAHGLYSDSPGFPVFTADDNGDPFLVEARIKTALTMDARFAWLKPAAMDR